MSIHSSASRQNHPRPDLQSNGNEPYSTDSYGSGGTGPVLLLKISTPKYPITVNVLHTISSPYGTVRRIVIFREKGVQAMIEFDSVESAVHAKQQLDGANIYKDCCKLAVCYAKPTRLNVYTNDNNTWDYTKPNLYQDNNGTYCEPLLPEPGRNFPRGVKRSFDGAYCGSRPQPHLQENNHFQPNYPRQNPNYPVDRWLDDSSTSSAYYSGNPSCSSSRHGSPNGRSSQEFNHQQQGYKSPVIIVYDLDFENITTDQLFNIFCLYGNVIGIRIVTSAKTAPFALVHMMNIIAAERAIANLNNAKFFQSKMCLRFSKSDFIGNVREAQSLKDGSPAFKSYIKDKNNRFLRAKHAAKARIVPPSNVLNFFSFPPNCTVEEIEKRLVDANVAKPINVKILDSASKNKRHLSGFIHFSSIVEGCEAVVMCNNMEVECPDTKIPYSVKISFTDGSRGMRSLSEWDY